MKRLIIILLFFASVLQGQTGAGFWHGSQETGSAPAGPDTLTLTYWDEFILLHIANTGITEDANGVSQWQDRSGNGNHSTQSLNTSKPSSGLEGEILFDGTDDHLEMSEFWNSANHPDSSFSVFIVADVNNTTSAVHKIFDYSQGSDSLLVYVFVANVSSTEFSVSVGVRDNTLNSGWQFSDLDTLQEGDRFLVTIVASESTSTQVDIDGVEKMSYVNDGSWAGADVGWWSIGSKRDYTDQFFDGAVYFVGVASRKFTPSEKATTKSELNSFFTIY